MLNGVRASPYYAINQGYVVGTSSENKPRFSAIDIPAVILAGGKSERFGEPKGLAQLNGQPLISLVAQRLQAQSIASVVVNSDPCGPYNKLGIECIPDQTFVDEGPLSGLLTAMTFAREGGYDFVVTAPVDTPLIPLDMMARLSQSQANAVAKYAGRIHPLCGHWSTSSIDHLIRFLETGRRSAYSWVEHCKARTVDFTGAEALDPFTNINTTIDLETLKARMASPDTGEL